MARDSRGRFTARRRPRAGGSRRPRILNADFGRAKEVGGVVTGEPIELGGGATVERKTSSTTSTKTTPSS